MRFAVLGSGSKGNALVVQGGGTTILVDAGFSPREIRSRLRSLDLDLGDVRAILLTHGHGDHVKGAKQIAGALAIRTYATDGTRRFCAGWGGLRNFVGVRAGESFRIAGLSIHPVSTPHDAPESVCYIIDDGDGCLGVCTDLGAPDRAVAQALSTCDALLIEHNHDEEMLRTGPYTARLKRRIAGPLGHLSNADGSRLLALAKRAHLRRVLLGHLSEVNNTPELAMASARTIIDGAGIELACAPQHYPTGWMRVQRRGNARRSSPAEPFAPSVSHLAAVGPRAGRPVRAGHIALARQLALFSTR